MTIPRFPASVDAATVAAALAEQGCAVIERLVPVATMDKVREDLRPWLEATRTLPDDLLRVMGYQRGAYALGYVGDLLDPLEALKGEGHRTTGLGNLESAIERLGAGRN